MTVNLSALAGAGQQFFDNNGNPLTGGKLWSYQAGTTTPQTTYTNAAGTIAHTNPIILDSAGRVATGEIWVTAGSNYKFVLMTSTDVTLATWDNITGVNGTGIATSAEYVSYAPDIGSLLYPLAPLTAKDALDELSNSDNGSAYVGFKRTNGGVAQTVDDKLTQTVSVFDFMTAAEIAAVQGSTFPTVNVTNAVHAAMTYLLDLFSGGTNFYPGGPGQPYDIGFSATDRRTGRIWFPSGAYLVSDQVFSSLDDPRAPFCGFEFVGEHRESSVLTLKTNGVEAWFYRNPAGTSRYQKILFRSLGFRSDDYRYGNFMTEWSDGGVKQMRFEHCDFRNLQKFLVTNGTDNADLTKVICCTGQFYGNILTLNNGQSVQHDFIGCDFGTYSNFINVQAGGGGNVSVINGSIDFLWHEDFSPVGGSWMFLMDSGAAVGQGNATFAFRDCRVEIEAYTRSAGAPPFGLVNSYGNPQAAIPRVLFENVNWVNGRTATIDANGNIVSEEYRRITAVQIFPRQNVEFKNCVLLKCFFYNVNGTNVDTAPNAGGILKFTDCFDGIIGELPPADSALSNLHSRVTYSSNAGRVITSGMVDHTTGSPFLRNVLDADPRWRYQFAREEASTKKLVSIKPIGNGWPQPDNTTYDEYINIPPGYYALRIYIDKPASGSSTNAYQLNLGNGDKSVIIASSVLAQHKDRHTIDVSQVDLSAYTQLRLWATGVGSNFQSGGIAYIEYV